jgi:hypothetical protein
MRYHYIPNGMTETFLRLTILSVGKDEKQLELSHITGGNAKW